MQRSYTRNFSRCGDILEMIQLPEVKIESPDQYVPLCLVLKDLYIKDQWEDPSTLSKEVYKTRLLEQYNHPYPSKYSFDLAVDFVSPSHINDWTPDEKAQAFFKGNYPILSRGTFVDLGVWFEYTTVQTTADTRKGCPLYPSYRVSTPYIYSTSSISFSPRLLILVQAKYIPELRIRYSLDLPIELPVSAMKFLRNTGLSIPSDLTYAADWKELTEMLPMAEVDGNAMFKFFTSASNIIPSAASAYIGGVRGQSVEDLTKNAVQYYKENYEKKFLVYD